MFIILISDVCFAVLLLLLLPLLLLVIIIIIIIFVPFVIKTFCTWNAQAIELTQEIGRRTTAVTGDLLETIHLFQRHFIAIQQANAVSFRSTFKSE